MFSSSILALHEIEDFVSSLDIVKVIKKSLGLLNRNKIFLNM